MRYGSSSGNVSLQITRGIRPSMKERPNRSALVFSLSQQHSPHDHCVVAREFESFFRAKYFSIRVDGGVGGKTRSLHAASYPSANSFLILKAHTFRHVRFIPVSEHMQCTVACRLGASSGSLPKRNITRAVVLGRLRYRPCPNARRSVRLAPGKYHMK